MATTIVPIFTGITLKIVGIIETVDAQVDVTIPHEMESEPLWVDIQSIKQPGGQLPKQQWIILSIDATNVVLRKRNGVGSGLANQQIRVTIALPHSMAK